MGFKKECIEIEDALKSEGYAFDNKELNRPWGAFWVISEMQKSKFVNQYFKDFDDEFNDPTLKISPKILMILPDKRLSWQYHHRRSELWKVVSGQIGVVKSSDDYERDMEIFRKDETIQMECGERHRIIGLNEVGIVAEIWIHSDQNNPSDEEDIVRLQDDFKRG